jgi:hypothetical protein
MCLCYNGCMSKRTGGLAVPGPFVGRKEREAAALVPLPDPATAKPEVETVRERAAILYGQGFKRRQIVNILVEYLCNDRALTPEIKRKQAFTKLRRWETQQSFRDLIYDRAVVKLDMQIPGILDGVAKKARRGRVDAARLVLEVTNRHNPKGETGPVNVTVQIANVPRPDRGE